MPELYISRLEYAEIGTDGTGPKTNNARSYRITKYGDLDRTRRNHFYHNNNSGREDHGDSRNRITH